MDYSREIHVIIHYNLIDKSLLEEKKIVLESLKELIQIFYNFGRLRVWSHRWSLSTTINPQKTWNVIGPRELCLMKSHIFTASQSQNDHRPQTTVLHLTSLNYSNDKKEKRFGFSFQMRNFLIIVVSLLLTPTSLTRKSAH